MLPVCQKQSTMFSNIVLLVDLQVGFGMNMNIIGGKDNKFTEAISLIFLGVHVAMFEQPLHKVITSIAFKLLLINN